MELHDLPNRSYSGLTRMIACFPERPKVTTIAAWILMDSLR